MAVVIVVDPDRPVTIGAAAVVVRVGVVVIVAAAARPSASFGLTGGRRLFEYAKEIKTVAWWDDGLEPSTGRRSRADGAGGERITDRDYVINGGEGVGTRSARPPPLLRRRLNYCLRRHARARRSRESLKRAVCGGRWGWRPNGAKNAAIVVSAQRVTSSAAVVDVRRAQ